MALGVEAGVYVVLMRHRLGVVEGMLVFLRILRTGGTWVATEA